MVTPIALHRVSHSATSVVLFSGPHIFSHVSEIPILVIILMSVSMLLFIKVTQSRHMSSIPLVELRLLVPLEGLGGIVTMVGGEMEVAGENIEGVVMEGLVREG